MIGLDAYSSEDSIFFVATDAATEHAAADDPSATLDKPAAPAL